MKVGCTLTGIKANKARTSPAAASESNQRSPTEGGHIKFILLGKSSASSHDLLDGYNYLLQGHQSVVPDFLVQHPLTIDIKVKLGTLSWVRQPTLMARSSRLHWV